MTSLAAKLGLFIPAMVAAVLLSACAGDDEIAYKEQSVYEIYSQAMTMAATRMQRHISTKSNASTPIPFGRQNPN